MTEEQFNALVRMIEAITVQATPSSLLTEFSRTAIQRERARFQAEARDLLVTRTAPEGPEPPITVTRWVNVYPDGSIWEVAKFMEQCDLYARAHRIACVPVTITYRPGEGLEVQS